MGSMLKSLSSFVALSFMTGIGLAGVAAPVAITSGRAVTAATESFDALPGKLPRSPLPQQSRIVAADGTLIGKFYTENRRNVKLSSVNKSMRNAIVAIEDTRFYQHGGVDPKGVARAAARNSQGESTQGASTLTQQYVKNVLLYNANTKKQKEAATAPTLGRKIREVRYATELEKTLTKNQILEGYLNIAFFGDGAYGVEAASLHFFSKHASRLRAHESALLAGLVQSPSVYNPIVNPKAARARRDVVLRRMHETGRLSKKSYLTARKRPLGLKVRYATNGCGSSKYPMYCEWIVDQLRRNPPVSKALLRRGGLVIRTSMDPKRQRAAERAAREAIPANSPYAAALSVVQPGTGRVLAMSSSRPFGAGPNQTMVVLPAAKSFQPGSTFKAFTLAAALEEGHSLNQKMYAQAAYCPPKPYNSPPGCFRNSSSVDVGSMDARTAMARSSNTFFVQLEVKTGVMDVVQMARRLGVGIPDSVSEVDASTTLGVHDVSTLEMATAYATFQADGVFCPPVGILAVSTMGGTSLYTAQDKCSRAVSPNVARGVRTALAGVVDGKDPARTGRALSIGRPVAGKTGTTTSNSAVWFSGFTPQLSTAVWVGDPRGGFANPIRAVPVYGRYTAGVAGATVAGPIWQRAMKGMSEGEKSLPLSAAPPASTSLTPVAPDVEGMRLPAAARALYDAGFKPHISKETADNGGPKDTVAIVRFSGTQAEIVLSEGSNVHRRLRVPASPIYKEQEGGIISREK